MLPSIRNEAQDRFLEAYRQSGIVLDGIEAACISRSTSEYWFAHDDAFRQRAEDAYRESNDYLRRELKRRVYEGNTEETLVYDAAGNIKEAKVVKRRSDTALIFLMKSRMAEFKDRTEASATPSGVLNAPSVDEPNQTLDLSRLKEIVEALVGVIPLATFADDSKPAI